MHEVIIFGNSNDQVSSSLLAQLQNDGQSVLMVTAEDLVTAQWKHTIDESGRCKTEIILQNKNVIHSGKVKAVFNRIRFLPMLQFVNATDRNYAEMEMFALYVSFLKSINHLSINPVQTNFLSMEEDNELQLKKLAIDAGFVVADYHFTSAPRWRQTSGLVPFNSGKEKTLASDKKSLNLVWENKPVLFKEAFNKAFKIVVVGSIFHGKGTDKYSEAISRFSHNTGTSFFELQMVQTKEGDKLGAVNRYPLFVDPGVIASLASLIRMKLGEYS